MSQQVIVGRRVHRNRYGINNHGQKPGPKLRVGDFNRRYKERLLEIIRATPRNLLDI